MRHWLGERPHCRWASSRVKRMSVAEHMNGQPPDLEAKQQAFFRAADETILRGGFIHSEFIASNTQADLKGLDVSQLFRDWLSSRQYPYDRIVWSKFGGAALIFAGFMLPIFSLVVFVEMNFYRKPGSVGASLLTLIGLGLIVTGIYLWRSATLLRRRFIEQARKKGSERLEQIKLAPQKTIATGAARE